VEGLVTARHTHHPHHLRALASAAAAVAGEVGVAGLVSQVSRLRLDMKTCAWFVRTCAWCRTCLCSDTRFDAAVCVNSLCAGRACVRLYIHMYCTHVHTHTYMEECKSAES
jgi:hypothetical protein